VGEWRVRRGEATGALQIIVEACLSRDPRARPPFLKLTEALRSLCHMPMGELFHQLELPRLREALDRLAAVLARPNHEPSRRAGQPDNP
jgi:hypothetical protein